MRNYTRIPAPRVTLVNTQTGIVADEWFRFFNNLYTIAYAATGSVTAGTYGSAIAVPQITVDDFGSITAVTNVPIAIDASQIVSGTIASARISGSYTGITGVGTLTAGTWNATAITTPYGGTGLTSYTAGDTLYYASGTALTKLAIGASTYINTSSGTAPQWTDPATITIGKATNLVGGAANRIAYQTAADTTGFIVAPTVSNTYLEWSGTAFQWSSNPLGTVTSVSVVSANGLAGTVATATTTPAITLSTTVTGLLKGNGTAISAASSGTDYAPATSGTSILYGNGAGGFSNVTIGTGVAFVAGTLSATGSGGTVTNVSGTGTVNGITLTGTVTTTGSLTLGGTLSGIGNSQLTNSTISGVALGGSLFNLTAGTGVSFSTGTTYNGSAAITINATGTGGTVTSVAASVPSFLSISGSPITTSGTLAITLSGTALPVTSGGTGSITAFTAGSVVFAGASGVYTQDNANFFWDDTNNRLGLGTTSPLQALDVRGRTGLYGASDAYQLKLSFALGTAGFWLGSPSANALSFYNDAGTERMRIDSSGNMGVGVTPSASTWIAGGTIPTLDIAKGQSYTAIQSKSYTTAAGGAGMLILSHSKSAVVGTQTATASGDALGYISFEGVNSSSAVTAGAYILSSQDGAAGATYIPGRFQFYTSNGAAAPAERMRIFSTGGVSIGNTSDPGATNLSVTGTGQFGTTVGVGAATPSASGAGITFPATQSASTNANTLDDYEEGTWTPTVTPQTGSLTAYSSSATYTKIGRLVYVNGLITITTPGTAAGTMALGAFPFTNGSSNQQSGICREVNSTGVVYQCLISGSATTGAISSLTNGAVVWTAGYIYEFALTYYASA